MFGLQSVLSLVLHIPATSQVLRVKFGPSQVSAHNVPSG
jgi:hypothetical protein